MPVLRISPLTQRSRIPNFLISKASAILTSFQSHSENSPLLGFFVVPMPIPSRYSRPCCNKRSFTSVSRKVSSCFSRDAQLGSGLDCTILCGTELLSLVLEPKLRESVRSRLCRLRRVWLPELCLRRTPSAPCDAAKRQRLSTAFICTRKLAGVRMGEM